jgi:hypothetical protein
MKGKKTYLLMAITLLLMVGLVSSYVNIALTTPANSTGIRERRPDFVFTPTTNESSAVCELNVGTTTQPENFAVTVNASNTIQSLTIPDGTYEWTVNCSAGTLTNASDHFDLTVDFNTYTGADAGKVSVDLIVGLGAALFTFIVLIGLAILFSIVKGKKIKPPF